MDSPDQQSEAGEQPAGRKRSKGLYLLPSAFTATNLGSGFYAIISTIHGHQLLAGTEAAKVSAAADFNNAARAIFVAILCDMLDGRVARLTKTNTEFGVQFDSIADVISFCIAPVLLAYVWGFNVAFGDQSGAHQFAFFVSFMYLICGAFRLARFNIQSARTHVLLEGIAKLSKNNFVGLPSPAAAAVIASVVHFAPQPINTYGDASPLYGGLLMLLVGALAALMVSKVRYPSFKSFGKTRFSARLGLLIAAPGIALLWIYSRYLLLALWSIYVLYGLVRALVSMLKRLLRRSGTPATDA
ncbi:MAG TPA: CDP-alcohol phosphatidyltransferase family protein [Pyrinomonadaceae bacterium]|nr:CDP-alcohol phosphatidyltransferase family protein [Pyrinomonadaceae bacterium]